MDTNKIIPLIQDGEDCSCQNVSKRLHNRAILVTGASGFIGKHFLEAFKEDYHIYALARRCQQMVGIPTHPNIEWFCGDIADKATIDRIIDIISDAGGIDYLFHFAGYYDFSNTDNPEYIKTNVIGTKNLLEAVSKKLSIKRFIFSSSLTVSEYRDKKKDFLITETSPSDAEIPYARSKRAAEALIQDYSNVFPCTIVRLAAIYSDWGEYGPLYVLLRNWLSQNIFSKIIPGKGKTALPYLHIVDLINLFKLIIRKQEELSSFDIVVASPDASISHNEMFDIVSRYLSKSKKPLHTPTWFVAIGIFCRVIFGKLINKPPFEQLWMLKYLDQSMNIDASRSRELLGWEPKERYQLKRRLLFLIDNMITNPAVWESKNKVMAHKVVEKSSNTKIYEAMLSLRERVTKEHFGFLTAPENRLKFSWYQLRLPDELRLLIAFSYEMLGLAVLSGNRHHVRCYAHQIALQRRMAGVNLHELISSLRQLAATTKDQLAEYPALIDHQPNIQNEFTIITQLMLDEVEEVYDAPLKNEGVQNKIDNNFNSEDNKIMQQKTA